jgi:hypothetical protein
VPCAVCRVPCAVCRVPCAVCRVPCAVCRVPCAVCRVPCAVCRVPSGPAQGQGGPRLTSWFALCQSLQQGIQPETTQLLAGKGAAAQAVLVGQALVLAPALQLAGHQRQIGVAVRQLLGQDVPRMPRRPPGADGQARQWPCLCPAQGPDGRTPCASEAGARQRSTPLRPAPGAVRGGPAWGEAPSGGSSQHRAHWRPSHCSPPASWPRGSG